MRATLAVSLLIALVPAPVAGQTTGVPGTNDLDINSQSSGATSCGTAFTPAGGGLVDFRLTGPASVPVILVAADSCVPGAVAVDPGPPVYSLDLNPAALTFVLDGTGTLAPSTPFLTSLAMTSSSGNWGVSFWANCASGPWSAWQAGLVDPAASTGLRTTQAVDVTCFSDPCAGATPSNALSIGDDASVAVSLAGAAPHSLTFDFYGNTYSTMMVNSNGNVTFCAGDSDFTPSQQEFLGDPTANLGLPRVAPLWNDWSPPQGGSVHVTQDDDQVNVMWCNVPQFGCTGDQNTFSVVFDKMSNDITIRFGLTQLCSGLAAPDQITGVSAGADGSGTCPVAPPVPSTASPVDLDTMPAGTSPYEAVYEIFFPTSGANPFDHQGKTRVFMPIPGPTYAVM